VTDPEPPDARLTLTAPELSLILKEDLTSFIERSFYELHPGQKLDLAPHIEVVATKLEAVRRGETNRLIINLPSEIPLRLGGLCRLASGSRSRKACDLCELRAGSCRRPRSRMPTNHAQPLLSHPLW
jgi:hypothetical protein